MSRVLTSPAGEQIEVLSDIEFAARLGDEPGSAPLSQHLSLLGLRYRIVEALWYTGKVEDNSGRAVSKLAERIGGATVVQITNAVRQESMAACLTTERGPKRTYSIRLSALPERWLLAESNRYKADPESETAPGPEPEVELVREPSPNGDAPVGRVDELEPMGLLTEAIRLIAQAMPGLVRTASDPEVLDRLATTLEDNERLRRKLRDLGEELAAVKDERHGLRQAKRALEANLTNMAKGAFNEVTYRRYVDLDRMIRETPRSAKDAS